MSKLNLHKLNDEVFVATDLIVKIGPVEVAFVKAQAEISRRKRARICAHKSGGEALHEMVIAISAQSYIHPHKHLGKSESFHVIEGMADVLVFDDSGAVTDLIELGDQTTGRSFFYRLPQGIYHTLLIKTEYLVVHEVTDGPFLIENTVKAPWAPSESLIVEVGEYMKWVARSAEMRKLAAENSSD